MTLLTLNRKELEKKVGKITKETEEKISMLGFPVESITNDEIVIEVFPNRPDVLSMSGFSRALLFYLGKKKPYKFKNNKPGKNFEVKIEKPVKKIRPYTCCAIVKGIKFDDEKIREIIDMQEKIHQTIGRKRKKLAIGVYPLEHITLPITYTAKKPEEIRFIPLEFDKEINGRQILSQHPAGREYSHLLESKDLFPVFIDAKGEILSMPPIINSNKTGKISQETKDVFIECSGFSLPSLKKTINIITTALADMGGKVYQMKVLDEKSFVSPELEPEEVGFKIEDINKTLGLNLKEAEIKKLLEKMGLSYLKEKAMVPAYRTDILHWIDLAEEIAIAYGYDNFEAEIPKISTIAEEDKTAVLKKIIAEILIGLEFQEVLSYHLTTKDLIEKIYPGKELIEVESSKTEFSVLRPDLLVNLLKILSENIDSQYPQKIFELGIVFSANEKTETGIEEKEKLCIAITHETANFTEIKQVLEYLLRMLEKECKIQPQDFSTFIEGRAGKILVEKKEIGVIGEISPKVLKDYKLKMPVVALEIDLDF